MTLIEKIKLDQLAARKAHHPVAAALLTTLLGEASAIGKNKGNREPTDSDVIAIVKKFSDNIKETIGHLQKGGNTNVSALQNACLEKMLIAVYLPKQMSEDELTATIKTIVEKVGSSMGKVMGKLNADHEGLYDGKMASAIV